MERFSGGENSRKKTIRLEDGTEIEAPEGVNDLYEYKQYKEEQDAREREKAESEPVVEGDLGETEVDEVEQSDEQEGNVDTHKEALKLASRIHDSVDLEDIKHALATDDYRKLFSVLSGVDSVPMKGDQMRIEQDGRKVAEAHEKYDAVMGEALDILRNEIFGAEVITGADKELEADAIQLAIKIEGSVDEKLVRECLKSGDYSKIFNALAGVDSVPMKGDQIRIDQDGRKLNETHGRYDAAMARAMELLKSQYFGDIDEQPNPESDEELGDTIEERDPDLEEFRRQQQEAEAEDDQETEENQEKERTREEMLNDLYSLEGMAWLAENGYDNLDMIRNLDDEVLSALHAEWLDKDVDDYEYVDDEEGTEEEEGAEEAETDEERNEKKPLVAVDIDRTRDAEAAARDIAERMLKEDLASGKGLKKFIKNIWKGNMFRGYYIEKNRKTAYDRIVEKQNGESDLVSDDSWRTRSEATVDRFISEYDDMIHAEAGEWRNALPENHPAAEAAKKAISEFAQGNMDEANFMQEMGRVKALLKDRNGDPRGEVVLDNYLEIARAAKGRFDHEEGIESIMEGFKLINGEARSNVRTEAHMGALDKIVDAYGRGKFTKFIPPEVVAGAASVAIWMTQAATKSAVKAATFGLGGAAVTGVVAGIKEGSRVATDRAQAAREAASGLVFEETDEKGKANKYDKAINSTLYEMTSASTLTGDLNAAVQSGDMNEIVQALAFADARTKMSDTRNIDLISYSDPTKIEDERFALDLARAEARAALKAMDPGYNDTLNQLTSGVETMLDEGSEVRVGIKAKDEAYKKLRRKQMIKQGVKTAAIAAGTMVVTQEVVAAFSADSYGLFDAAMDKAGIQFEPFNIGVNNVDANNTMIAGMLGLEGPGGIVIGGTERVDAQEATGVKLTDEEVAQLREEGYVVNQMESTTLENQEVSMSASEYAREYGTPVSRDDWGSNGTTAFDGNELNAHYTTNGEGIITRMSGNSTTWGGETINFQEAVNDGKITALISLTGDSQSTPIELVGQVVNNGTQLEFIPEPGTAAAECFQDGKFIGKYFEIVFNNGVAEDGTQHVIPLATVVGQGIEGAITTNVDVPVAETVYNVIGFDRATEAVQAVGDRFINPAALLPFVRRDNLKNARRRAPGPEAPTQETAPEGEGNQIAEEPEIRTVEEASGGGGAETEAQQPQAEIAEAPTGDGGTSGETPQPEATEQTSGAEATEDGAETSEETGETEGTQESEPEASEYDEEGEPIWENMRNKLGEGGVWLVNGGLDSAPEEVRNMNYQRWWDNLSEEMKDRFAWKGGEVLTPESDTLADWLSETGKMSETAAEAYGRNDALYEDMWNRTSDQEKEDLQEGRYVPGNRFYVEWLRENNHMPASENEAPAAEAEGEGEAAPGEQAEAA